MNHWANNYIGKKYEVGARGPDTFDCWGLVRDVYEKVYGISLPEWIGLHSENTIDFPITRAIREEWVAELKPFEGCVAAMSARVAFHHVGIYMGQDRILHAASNIGGVFVNTLREMKIRFLFKTVKFYRHSKWPTS